MSTIEASAPDTNLVPSGENAHSREIGSALDFSLNSSSLPARQASRRQFWPRRGDFEGSGAPKSQTLIVLSCDPDTILVPSGENATDRMMSLWAFVFSATQFMSIAIILRTRDVFLFSSMEIWDHERLQARRSIDGSRRRHATAHSMPEV